MTKVSRQSAIDKALEILFCVADQSRDVGVSEITEILGSDKATVFRALKALEKYGLIEQNEETKKYRLGLPRKRKKQCNCRFVVATTFCIFQCSRRHSPCG